MIFLTVGAQMPFDRLVETVDRWAGSQFVSVFAQIGPTDLVPEHLDWTHHLSPQDFRSHFSRASLVVGHAGMGTIISALEFQKPLVVLPRRGYLRETRNDHQFATALRFADRVGIYVALEELELPALLDSRDTLAGPEPVGSAASEELLSTIRGFVAADR